jgi:hypothetical protein
MLIDGEDKYDIKAILDSQMRCNHFKSLVKWKGYDDGHNSWQVHHQFHAQAKVEKFHHNNPGASHHINAASFTQADLATTWRSSCRRRTHVRPLTTTLIAKSTTLLSRRATVSLWQWYTRLILIILSML